MYIVQWKYCLEKGYLDKIIPRVLVDCIPDSSTSCSSSASPSQLYEVVPDSENEMTKNLFNSKYVLGRQFRTSFYRNLKTSSYDTHVYQCRET